jgi:hypothetical protein
MTCSRNAAFRTNNPPQIEATVNNCGANLGWNPHQSSPDCHESSRKGCGELEY